MEITLVLTALIEGLKLLNKPEGDKLLRRVNALEMEYLDELKKPFDLRSQLYLDERVLEINVSLKNFIALASKK